MWLFVILLVQLIGLYYCWKRSRFHLLSDYCLDGILRLYVVFWKRILPTKPPDLPKTGPAILIANHTCSADPSFLFVQSPRILSYLVTHSHYYLHPLATKLLDYIRCVPVRTDGTDVWGVRQALRRLQEEGCVLMIFPEGGLSGVGLNRPRRAQHGAAYLALKTGVPVFPAYIARGPQTDKLLESWLKWPTPAAQVHFGSPIDLSAYRNRPITRRTLEEVSVLFMNKIIELQPKSETPQKPFSIPKEATMSTDELTQKKCVPCEGGVPTLTPDQVQKFLQDVNGWKVIDDGKSIRRDWQLKNFVQCLDFFQKVGQIAEEEGHHPDLHLTGYRNAGIEITTHAIGGLSENDFILAAKIDQVSPA